MGVEGDAVDDGGDEAQLIEQQEIQAAVTADDAGQLPVVGSFGELVDQLGGSGVANPAALGHGT